MSADRLRRDHVDIDGARIVYASDNGQVVGHAFGVIFNAKLTNPHTSQPEEQSVGWLTQLVVHTAYRHRGIASTLCHTFWSPEQSVWGLVTSHPHAVRALERARHVRCDPKRIAINATELVEQTPVPYVNGREHVCNDTQVVINTDFDVDHSDIQRILGEFGSQWRLGELKDGWEFLAFVFMDQITPMDK